MATETAGADVKTEKVYDLTKGEYIDKPIEEKKIQEHSKGRSKEGSDNIAERKAEEEATLKVEKKGEKEAEKKEAEKKEEKIPEIVAPDYNKYLKDKFGVDDEDTLLKLLDGNKKLTADLEEAKKPKEYEFKSPKEKAIADFLKDVDWDMDNAGEGVEMAGRLMKMDPEKMNEKIALQEQYILQNNDITRDKAIKLFNDEYKTKYVLDKEKYESEDEYKEAQELADIKKEKASVAAKKFLLEKKETLKFKERPAKEEQKQPEKIEIPKETIDKYVGDVNKFFEPSQGENFDRFTFQDDDDKDLKVTVQFTKEEVQNLKKEVTSYLNSPSPYGQDKKIDKFDAGNLVRQVSYLLYGDQIQERMLKEVVKLAKTLRIEQLAEKKPDKKSGGGGKGEQGIPDVSTQFAELAKREAAKRAAKK